MRTISKSLLLLLCCLPAALAQQTPQVDVALTYTFTRANELPSIYGAFGMHGGTGEVTWHLKPRFSLVAEIGATHASDATLPGRDITLASYLFGVRFSPVRRHAELQRNAVTPYV